MLNITSLSTAFFIFFISCHEKSNQTSERKTKHNIVEKTEKKKKNEYLHPKVVYYNLRSYTGEPNINNMHITLHDFKPNTYKSLNLKYRALNGDWDKDTSILFTPSGLDKSLTFDSDSILIGEKIHGLGMETIEYDSLNRISYRRLYFTKGKSNFYSKHNYPNDSTIILTNHVGNEVITTMTNTLNKSGLIKHSLIEGDEKTLYKLYEYDENNLLKTYTLCIDNTDTSDYHYKYHMSYIFNQHGDWAEMLIEVQFNNSKPEQHSKILRKFK